MALDRTFWDGYFSVYDTLNELIPYRELLARIAALAEVGPEMTVLDAGSGTGNLSILFEGKCGGVTALDSSPAGIARHRAKSSDPSVRFLVGDLTLSIPAGDGSFDRVVSNNVIYAIAPEKRAGLMKEFFRVMKPGGRIVIANIAPGFRPFSIYTDHLARAAKHDGAIRTAARAIGLVVPTIRIFAANRAITREHAGGAYEFIDEDGHRALFEEGGFTLLGTERAYAGQSVIAYGIKDHRHA